MSDIEKDDLLSHRVLAKDLQQFVEIVPPEQLTVVAIRKSHVEFMQAFTNNGGYVGYETQCIDVLLKHIDKLEAQIKADRT